MKEKFQCDFQIIKSLKKSIFIGVVNPQKQKERRSSFSSGNALAMYGGGRVWYGEVMEGKCEKIKFTFQEGDRVSMLVERSKGRIEWKVNNQASFKKYSEILSNSQEVIAPYIELKH